MKNKPKMENTNWSYVELTETSDEVTSVDEQLIEQPASEYAIESNNAQIDNDTETTYPDLVFKYEVTSVEINGTPVDVKPLIAGHHPPARPR